MSISKKNLTVVAFSLILAGCLGFAIGVSLNRKGGPPIDIENEHSNSVAVKPPTNSQFEQKTMDELTQNLSEIMLPDEEFNKLRDAIFQTAMGLFMAQAQGQGLEVNESAEQELKSSIDKKYSRQFFASTNANTMKELSREDVIAILSFYGTEPGGKFLKISPKIIEVTMTLVQNDLSQWLPSTVEALVSKLKGAGGARPGPGNIPQPPRPDMPMQAPPGSDPAQLDREDVNG